MSQARGFWTYRGWKRNKAHGRKAKGNTKPNERPAVRAAMMVIERAAQDERKNA